jgi:hypothetical protein
MEAHRYDAEQSFKLRPQFYRRLYRLVLKVVFINSMILSVLCVLTVYLSFYGFKPEHYFTTSQSGRLLQLHYSTTRPYPKAPTESHGQTTAPPAK